MRVKNVRKTRKSLHEAAEEFIAFKTAQKARERTFREQASIWETSFKSLLTAWRWII